MKILLIFGSIFAVVILVLASFPSVVGYQTAKSTILSKAKDSLGNIDDKDIDRLAKLLLNRIETLNRFKNIDVNERTSAIQHMKNGNIDGGLYPDCLLILIFLWLFLDFIIYKISKWSPGQNLSIIITLILEGKWYPGLIILFILAMITGLLWELFFWFIPP